MSGTVNKVILIGHLGDDVKMHYFEGGGSVGHFPLATNETYVSKQTGEKVTNTEWHNIVVRNKLAETCEKYARKGDRVYVEGRIRTRQWQDEAGTTRYNTEIVTSELTFLSSKKDEMSYSSETAGGAKSFKMATASTSKEEQEDDLPF